MFENWVLRLIFGHKEDEVTRERRRLHNGEHMAFNLQQNLLGCSNQ